MAYNLLFNVLRTSLNTILHKGLHLQPYKTNMGQHVTPPTHCVQYPKEMKLTGQLIARTYPQ